MNNRFSKWAIAAHMLAASMALYTGRQRLYHVVIFYVYTCNQLTCTVCTSI